MSDGADFSAQVAAWVRASKERLLAVRNEAVQHLVEVIQTPVAQGGAMPIETGFLRASLVAKIGFETIDATSPPTIVGPAGLSKTKVQRFAYDAGAVGVVLLKAKLSDPITLGWSAAYARYVEFGTHGRPGRAFARMGIQRWPQIVDEVARQAYARGQSGARQ